MAKGNFGKVYEALDRQTGQLLAVKILKLSSKGDMEQRNKEIKEIRNEISILSQLRHQNIVRYIHSQISENDPNEFELIMEMVSGGSIRKLLDKFKCFDEGLVSIYTQQILTGLAYLHHKGIVHLDLKCANILIDTNCVIKLSDFGAS